jgi:hypothetical protein
MSDKRRPGKVRKAVKKPDEHEITRTPAPASVKPAAPLPPIKPAATPPTVAAAKEAPPRARDSAHPATEAAPKAPDPTRTIEGEVARLRDLAADLKSGDPRRIWDAVWDELDRVRDGHEPAAATRVGADDEAMKPSLAAINELCQKVEREVTGPQASAAAVGGGRWVALVLPILTQILRDFLARRA